MYGTLITGVADVVTFLFVTTLAKCRRWVMFECRLVVFMMVIDGSFWMRLVFAGVVAHVVHVDHCWLLDLHFFARRRYGFMFDNSYFMKTVRKSRKYSSKLTIRMRLLVFPISHDHGNDQCGAHEYQQRIGKRIISVLWRCRWEKNAQNTLTITRRLPLPLSTFRRPNNASSVFWRIFEKDIFTLDAILMLHLYMSKYVQNPPRVMNSIESEQKKRRLR
jgi:hypothetical protein